MATDRAERFRQGILGTQRKFPWSWQKTAAYVVDLKKTAQELAGAPADTAEPVEDKEDIIRGLLQVHQDQQATVAAAEQESRSLRQELDQARQSLHQQFQQLQQQQGQMQQLQGQSQQAVQQAQMQAQQLQMTAGPQIQQAQQQAAMAGQEATQAKIQLSQVQQTFEQTRRAVLDYKQRLMEVASQDPVTMAEAQKMQQAQMQQQQMAVAQQQQQQAMAQQAQGQQGGQELQAPEQGQGPQAQGQPPQAEGPQGKPRNPLEALSSMIAGQGERAGIRRAMVASTLQQGMQQGQQQGQGGIVIPEDSLAGMVMKQGSDMARSLKALQAKTAQPSPNAVYLAPPGSGEPDLVEDPLTQQTRMRYSDAIESPVSPVGFNVGNILGPWLPSPVQGGTSVPAPAPSVVPVPVPQIKTSQGQVWGPEDIEAFKKLVPPPSPVQATGGGPGYQDVRDRFGDAEIRLNPATITPAGPSASASIQRPAPTPVPVPAPIQPPTPGGLGSVP